MSEPTQTFSRWLGALWGVAALATIILQALLKLWPIVGGSFYNPLTSAQMIFCIGWILFMAYFEGYRGFQKSFAPRYAARALHLKQSGKFQDLLAAPFFCMGFYAASKRTRIVAWALTGGISLLVLLVRELPLPWRGLVDLGVIVGLSWGLLSLFYNVWLALILNRFPADPDLKKETNPVSV